MQHLERYLQELHALTGPDAVSSLMDPEALVADIKSVCLHKVARRDLAMCRYLLLASPHNVLSFLTSSASRLTGAADLLKTRVALVQLLDEFVKFVGLRQPDHALSIVRTLFNVYKRDQYNKVKVATFAPISRIIQLKMKLLDAQKLDVKGMADYYLRDFTVNKPSATVKGEMLRLLGMLSQSYPECMYPLSSTLQHLYLDMLTKHFNASKPEMTTLSGALDGLCSLLVHFSGDFVADSNAVKSVYGFICLACEPPPTLVRYAVPRAGLRFLATHSVIFKQYLTEDSENMYTRLSALCKHSNKENRDLAMSALDAMLLHVAQEIVSNVRTQEADERTFRFFIKKFFSLLESPETAQFEEIRIAVFGFGRFAGPVARFMSQQDLRNVLQKLFEYSARYYFDGKSEQMEESIRHLSAFIEAFANIILHLDHVDEGCVHHLVKILGTLFGVFPFLYARQKVAQYFAVSRLFVSLWTKGSALKTLISRVAFQGLTLTCGAISPHADPHDDVSSSRSAFRQYVPLWKAILSPYRLTDMNLEAQERLRMCSVIYDHFMEALILLLQKLNLHYSSSELLTNDDLDSEHVSERDRDNASKGKADVTSVSNDKNQQQPNVVDDAQATAQQQQQPQQHTPQLTAANMRDHELFLNLVDFCEQLLPSKHTPFFCRWVFILGRLLINKANEYPLVSGFYKLMAIVFVIAERESFFDGVNAYEGQSSGAHDDADDDVQLLLPNDVDEREPHDRRGDDDSDDVDDDGERVYARDDESSEEEPLDADAMAELATLLESNGNGSRAEGVNRLVCFRLFAKFVSEIITRMEQYQDELVASCLRMVLSVPKAFINVPLLVPALRSTFRMGLSFVPLAELGLDALERWMRLVPDRVRPHLHRILPSLNDYLYPMDEHAEQQDPRAASSRAPSRASTAFRGGHFEVVDQGAGRALQHRVLRLLGRIGGHNHLLLPQVALSCDPSDMAWDTQKRILLPLSFQDCKPSIHLDEFLPRVAVLAESASDRKVKIAACELLHAVVLYAIGLNASRSDTSQGEATPFHRIYKRIFPCLLRLATDVDQVTRQLFEPLVLQIIHWFTGNAKRENVETMALLDSIVEALGSPDSGALRRYASQCMAEFCKWSVKHVSDSTLKDDPYNIDSLLKRLHSLAQQPSPHKRLGASLTMNLILRVLRQHDMLVSKYAMQIGKVMLLSLRMADRDAPSVGTAEQAQLALAQVARILRKRSKLLQRKDKRRPEDVPNLGEFVRWLFTACCARPEAAARQRAVAMFDEVAPTLEGVGDASEWVAQKYGRGANRAALVAMFEAPLVRKGASAWPQHDVDESLASHRMEAVLAFLRALQTTMGAQAWLLSRGFVSPSDMVDNGDDDDDDSAGVADEDAEEPVCHTWSCIAHFTNTIVPLFEPIAVNTVTASLTPHEVTQLRCAVGHAAVSVLTLMRLLLTRHPKAREPSVLWRNPTVLAFVATSLLCPHELGLGDADLLADAAATLAAVLPALRSWMGRPKRGQVRKYFLRHLTHLVTSGGLCLAQLDLRAFDADVPTLCSLVRGYRLLHRSTLLADALGDGVTLTSLVNHLLTQLFDHSEHFTPLHTLLGSQVLRLCFDIGVEPQHLLTFLLDETTVADLRAPERTPSAPSLAAPSGKGALFYDNFRADVNAYVARRLGDFVRLLLPAIRHNSVALYIVNNLLDARRQRSGTEALSALDAPHVGPGARALLRSDSMVSEAEHTEDLATAAMLFASQVPSSATPLEDDGDDLMVTTSQDEDEEEHTHLRILHIILNHLHLLDGWADLDTTLAEKHQLLVFLERVISVDAETVLGCSVEADDFGVLASRASAGLGREWMLRTVEKLMHRQLPLPFKTHVMRLLPPFLMRVAGPDLEPLYARLDEVVVYDFPTKSTDVSVSSALYVEYVDALDAMLHALAATGSTRMLRIMFPVIRERKHSHALAINDALAAFVGNLSEAGAVRVVRFCMTTFEDPEYDMELKGQLVSRIVTPIIHRVDPDTCTDLFEQYVCQLVRTARYTKVELDRMRITQQESADDLLQRACAYDVLRAFYKAVPGSLIKARVNKAYVGREDTRGTELTAAVMKAAHHAKSRHIMRSKSVPSRVILAYHAAAYNALAAVVMATQNKDSFFTVFFFKEKAEKGEVLWNNIVDVDQPLVFDVETEFTTLANVVDNPEAASEAGPDALNRSLSGQRDVRLLTSSYLAGSSLSQDISETTSFFGPTAAALAAGTRYWDAQGQGQVAVVVEGEGGGRAGMAEQGDVMVDADHEPVEDLDAGANAAGTLAAARRILGHDETTYELDTINCNPCMPTLLELVDTMCYKFGHSYDATSMPKWMQFLLEKMCAPSTHANVRWFLAKLVLHRPAVFEPYGQQWMRPLLNLCLSCERDEHKRGFHYFLRDICILLLGWSSVAPGPSYDDRVAASNFMNHLIRVSPYPRGSVLHDNLVIFNLLFARWHRNVTLAKRYLLDLMTVKPSHKSAKLARLTGLSLMATVVDNELPVWDPETDKDVAAAHVYEGILDNLSFANKKVYSSCAELCGLVLYQLQAAKQLPAPSSGRAHVFVAMLEDRVSSVFASGEHGRAITVLAGVTKYYPAFLDAFLVKVFDVLGTLVTDFKALALTVMAKRPDAVVGAFPSLRPHLSSLLGHRDVGTQLAAVGLLRALAPHLRLEDMLAALPLLLDHYTSHRDQRCRLSFYVLLQGLYEAHHASMAPEPLRQVRVALLRGLADEDEEARRQVEAFWDDSGHLSHLTHERLTLLLTDLYAPQVEHVWLHYSCALLLSLTKHTPDYTQALFRAPLAECVFQDYSIDSSWALRSAPMTPLFSQSYASQASQGSSSMDPSLWAQSVSFGTLGSSLGPGMLRPSLQGSLAEGGGAFTPTQMSLFASGAAAAGATTGLPIDVKGMGRKALHAAQREARRWQRKEALTRRRAAAKVREPHDAAHPTFLQQMAAGASVSSSQGEDGDGDVSLSLAPSSSLSEPVSLSLDNPAAHGATHAPAHPEGRASVFKRPTAVPRRRGRTSFVTLQQEGRSGGASMSVLAAIRSEGRSAGSSGSASEAGSGSPGSLAASLAMDVSDGEQSSASAAHASRAPPLRVTRVHRRFDRGLRPSLKLGRIIRASQERSRRRREVLHRIRLTRQANVEMHRRYRVGELPDVQIQLCDLIKPLATLCRKDAQVARITFTMLVDAILSEKDTSLIEGTRAAIARILAHTQHEPSLVAALLGVCQRLPALSSELPAHSIKIAALRSHNLHAGIALLEQRLRSARQVASQPSSKRRRRGGFGDDDTTEANTMGTWLALAKLYMAVRDRDTLMGLLEGHVSQRDVTQHALNAEVVGDYEGAFAAYDGALARMDEGGEWPDGRPTGQELELWEDGRLESLSKLLRWDELAQNVMQDVDQKPLKLWSGDGQEALLGHFVRSHVHIRDQWALLEEWLTQSSSKPLQRDVLEREFGPELAFLAMARSDFDRARHYVDAWMDHVLASWASLHRLASARRHELLQRMQRVVEVDEVLRFLAHERNFSSVEPLRRLLSRWQRRYPDPNTDDVCVWDETAYVRVGLLRVLATRFRAYEGEGGEIGGGGGGGVPVGAPGVPMDARLAAHMVEGAADGGIGDAMDEGDDAQSTSSSTAAYHIVRQLLLNTRLQAYRRVANTARKQGLLTVSDTYLKLSLRASLPKGGKAPLDLDVFFEAMKLYERKAAKVSGHNATSDHKVLGLRRYLKALSIFDTTEREGEDLLKVHPVNHARFLLLKARMCESAGRLSQRMASASIRQATSGVDCFGDHKPATKEVTKWLYARALEMYRECAQVHRAHLEARGALAEHGDTHAAGKAFLRFGLFCELVLSANEAKESRGTRVAESAAQVATNFLDALRYGNATANDYFPRLLELAAKYPNTLEATREGLQRVPVWGFIRWISHIMATLGSPESAAVMPVMQQLASAYPRAVYYPFRVSADALLGRASAQERERLQQLMQPLRQQLQDDVTESLIAHLERLQHPEHRFKDWGDHVKRLAGAGDAEGVREAWREYRERFLDPRAHGLGSYHAKWIRTWGKRLKHKFGADGSALSSWSPKTLSNNLRTEYDKMKQAIQPNGTKKEQLSAYSEWLSTFMASDHAGSVLEVPGQYEGLRGQPHPEDHVRIASFGPETLVMGSMRKPKRLTVHGSDEADHMFLVKGGEDLRLDQRIQHLFHVMNALMVRDPSCRQRNFHITTYRVIPMTCSLGVLQWLSDTKPIKHMIEEEMAAAHRGSRRGREKPSILGGPAGRLHEKWLHSLNTSRKAGAPNMYWDMFKGATRPQAEATLHSLHELVDRHLLRTSLTHLASSPESFLSIRALFARSLAVFNIASYILGIGDRHLENFLLDVQSGSVVGIDFGHAFGTATQIIPIPELVPFRLTRQLRGVLDPLGVKGLMKHHMVHSLTCFHSQAHVLLNILAIFVKEPLLDWEGYAERAAHLRKESKVDLQWYPQEKIDIAKRKLELHNPLYLTLQELKSCNAMYSAKGQDAMRAILSGNDGDRFRSRVGEVCDNVMEQVECLIDQATDPNILVRAWRGWASW